MQYNKDYNNVSEITRELHQQLSDTKSTKAKRYKC